MRCRECECSIELACPSRPGARAFRAPRRLPERLSAAASASIKGNAYRARPRLPTLEGACSGCPKASNPGSLAERTPWLRSGERVPECRRVLGLELGLERRRAGARMPESGAGVGAGAEAQQQRRRRRRRPSSVTKSGVPKDSRRKWLKVAFFLSSAMLAYLLSGSYLLSEDGVTEVLARYSEVVSDKFIEIPCSEDYDSHKRFEGCTPRKCGRGVTDALINREEAERIRRIAERGLSLGGSDGGASILDLHSGALSLGKHFVNMYRYFGDKIHDIFTEEDFQLYRDVRQRIQQKIALVFGISSSSMHLTKPTFFSRINNSEAKTTHDEYWHPHIDKVTYGSFDYTSLLYLSDYSEDFGGGRFVFMDEGANRTVEPRAGRVSFFTSGSENLHHVEKVHWGTRYAITISFTCNPDHGIGDPVLT
nr:2-oxoglutarate and iron-dependent oxygenase domain-containing protein 3 [Pogona vitticeps]